MSPGTQQVFRAVLPNFDLTTAGGLLQLVFVQLGFIVIGFAAATLVAGWASDETAGRLEMLLATPLARIRWAVSSAIGVYLAIAVMTVVLAAAVGIGALLAGSDAVTPMAGSVTLGLYAAAVAGVGVAIGGLSRTSIAAEVSALLVTATFLIDLIAPPLKLPDWVHGLALTAHMGQPMVGVWDFAGIATCLGLQWLDRPKTKIPPLTSWQARERPPLGSAIILQRFRCGRRGGVGTARMQGHGDHSGAAEQHVDADQQSERPGRRARQAAPDDGRQNEVDDAADQHPAPSSRKLLLVLEGVEDREHAFNDEERDQEQRERDSPR